MNSPENLFKYLHFLTSRMTYPPPPYNLEYFFFSPSFNVFNTVLKKNLLDFYFFLSNEVTVNKTIIDLVLLPKT